MKIFKKLFIIVGFYLLGCGRYYCSDGVMTLKFVLGLEDKNKEITEDLSKVNEDILKESPGRKKWKTCGDFVLDMFGMDLYKIWGNDLELKYSYENGKPKFKLDDFKNVMSQVTARLIKFPLGGAFVEVLQEFIFSRGFTDKSVTKEVYSKWDSLGDEKITKYVEDFIEWFDVCSTFRTKVGGIPVVLLGNVSFLENAGIKVMFNRKEVDTCKELSGQIIEKANFAILPTALFLRNFNLSKDGKLSEKRECYLDILGEKDDDFYACIKGIEGEKVVEQCKIKNTSPLPLFYFLFQKDAAGNYRFLKDSGVTWNKDFYLDISVEEKKIKELLCYCNGNNPVFKEGKRRRVERYREINRKGGKGVCDNCCPCCCRNGGCCYKCC